MKTMYEKLKEKNLGFVSKIDTCRTEAIPILKQIVVRFPTYTNHDIDHSDSVISICEYFIGDKVDLSDDEIYILLMASVLHDIGMAVSDEQLKKYCAKIQIKYSDSFTAEIKQEIIRDHHHIFSQFYIMDEWQIFDIPSEKYAEIISSVAKGHRKVELLDYEYNDNFVKSGAEKVRVCFLAAVLRMADEFDISADRTSELYCKYFFPNNKTSQEEFKKHLATTFIRYGDEGNATATIIYKTDDINGYNSLKTMFSKIETQLEYCQKILNTKNLPELQIRFINSKNECMSFAPIYINPPINKNLYMKKYENKGGKSNVVAYEYGNDYITIQFGSGSPYTYSYDSAGKENVEAMKQLADAGKGLNSYVMKYVRKLYVI